MARVDEVCSFIATEVLEAVQACAGENPRACDDCNATLTAVATHGAVSTRHNTVSCWVGPRRPLRAGSTSLQASVSPTVWTIYVQVMLSGHPTIGDAGTTNYDIDLAQLGSYVPYVSAAGSAMEQAVKSLPKQYFPNVSITDMSPVAPSGGQAGWKLTMTATNPRVPVAEAAP